MVTMPVEKDFYVTSGFGPRWSAQHWGVDFGAPGGSGGRPVYAVKDGTVARSGPASGFGQWVGIDHPATFIYDKAMGHDFELPWGAPYIAKPADSVAYWACNEPKLKKV